MTSIIVMAVAILILLVVSAIASASEIAIEKSNKVRLNVEAENGNKKAKLAQKHCEDFTSTLTSILFTNNLVNIGATSLATLIAIEIAKQFDKIKESSASTVSTIIITVVLLLVGEILPKIYATDRADSFVLFCARPISIVKAIFIPIVKASNALVNSVSKLWRKKEEMPTVTQEELATIVEEIEEEGVLSEKESELILNTLDFSEQTAQDILIPRVDVSAIDIDDDIEDILKYIEKTRYSRLPVFKYSMDSIIGILPVKKLVREYYINGEVDIESLLSEPYYVHMTKSISSILKEMKQNTTKMAVVIDEYGGTMGIVTMEDILEEIFGEIYDENDIVEPDSEKKSDNDYIFDGSINLHDMFDILGYDDEDVETDYTTAGGWVTEKLDKIPEEGEEFEFDNMNFKVTEMDGLRVEKIEVMKEENEDDEE